MKFNRQLFKEAFKQGYKAAKRLNERKIDSFDKTYQKRGREGYFGSWADKAQKILNQGSKEANEIRQYLQELNDDRPLEQYLKPLDRFYGLYNYLFGTYSSNQRPNNSEIKEIYKTYLNADTNLDNLFDIINNTKYDDREAKSRVLKSISNAMDELKEFYKLDFKRYFGNLKLSDLDPKYYSDEANSIRGQLYKKQTKKVHNTARGDINMHYSGTRNYNYL